MSVCIRVYSCKCTSVYMDVKVEVDIGNLCWISFHLLLFIFETGSLILTEPEAH